MVWTRLVLGASCLITLESGPQMKKHNQQIYRFIQLQKVFSLETVEMIVSISSRTGLYAAYTIG